MHLLLVTSMGSPLSCSPLRFPKLTPQGSPGSHSEHSQVGSGRHRGRDTEGDGTSTLGELRGDTGQAQVRLWGWFDSLKRGFTGQQGGDLVDNCRVLLPSREGEMAHERAYFDILRSHESLFHPLNVIESRELQKNEPGLRCGGKGTDLEQRGASARHRCCKITSFCLRQRFSGGTREGRRASS